jgi:hypothetical protein
VKKTSRDQLFNANVTSAVDSNKTSDREAVQLLIPTAAALGHDPNHFLSHAAQFNQHEQVQGMSFSER